MIKKQKNIVILLSTIMLLFTSIFMTNIGTAFAQSENQFENPFLKQSNEFIKSELPGLMDNTEVLYLIEDIPDSVINEGREAILNWFKNNIKNSNTLIAFEQANNPMQTRSILGCASAVGIALVSLAWAPAKILKIKKALKALGGTKTFVTKSIQYYKVYRKQKFSRTQAWKKATSRAAAKVSPEIRDALLGFFGISAIIDACTS